MHSHLPDVRIISEVLLVEDDPAYARLVEIFLKNSEWIECSLTIVFTLKDALHILGERSFSAVLLDLSLPDSEGFETLSAILSSYPNLTVIVMTGRSDHGLGLQTLEAGAQDFLVKGEFEADHIGKALRYAIERSQITIRLEEAQHIAKMGHWQWYPARRRFVASNEVYHIMGMPKEAITYDYLESENCPLFFLNQMKQDALEFKESKKELFFLAPDGRRTYIEALCRYDQLPAGESFFSGIIQDISERRSAEEMRIDRDLAEQAVKVREQILASVSHEMRTPMNAIVGMTNLMALTPLTEEQRNYLSAIEHSSEVLLGIINDILQAASLNHEGLTFEKKPFALREMLQHLVRLVLDKIGNKPVAFEWEVEKNVPNTLIGDKLRLYQILNNLLENAVKFTDRGSICLQVKTKASSTDPVRLQFEIKDTGIGIPPESLDTIFSPFTRISRKDRSTEGTGLGLSIAKTLVERQGGRIDVSSKLNVGSVFHLELPFEIARPETNSGVQESDPTWINPAITFRILVVEDHRINQLVAKYTLEKKWSNIEVLLANNGDEGIAVLESEPVDLILMDLEMPVRNGYETSAYIRRNMNGPTTGLPIIAMTAHAHVGENKDYQQHGMNDYILKPFVPEQLFIKIAYYLNKPGMNGLPVH